MKYGLIGYIRQWQYDWDIYRLLAWYRRNWEVIHYQGLCAIRMYENNRELTSQELYNLGFLR